MLTEFIPFVIWIDLAIAFFSVPLFAAGLAHLLRVAKQQASSEESESDLRVVSITWGLLIFALLSSNLLRFLGS